MTGIRPARIDAERRCSHSTQSVERARLRYVNLKSASDPHIFVLVLADHDFAVDMPLAVDDALGLVEFLQEHLGRLGDSRQRIRVSTPWQYRTWSNPAWSWTLPS